MVPSPLHGAIVAMNSERVIGLNGALPWHYSADLKRFKRRTQDHNIVMGRLTWESIGAKPLPKRRNIVISRQAVNGAERYRSIEEALEQCADEDVWFIGGGRIYAASLPYLNLLDITHVPDIVDVSGAVRFPQFDHLKWKLTNSGPLEEDPRLINKIYIRR